MKCGSQDVVLVHKRDEGLQDSGLHDLDKFPIQMLADSKDSDFSFSA